jgi:4-hydroxy-tetrahydrodipicolinate reductase
MWITLAAAWPEQRAHWGETEHRLNYMKTSVCVAGATGWVGRLLCVAIADSEDLQLTGAVSRSAAGKQLSEVLGRQELKLQVCGSVAEALKKEKADVLVDYTRQNVVKCHVLQAIEQGVRVVIGTSGLTDQDYQDIDRAAQQHSVGVLSAGNFAITAVLMQVFAAIAAKHVPSWEVLDYAHADKVDAPSGTTRELAFRLGKVGSPKSPIPIEQTQGAPEARGVGINGTQIHSIRLPGFMISAEVIFGLPDERLTIRHDAGSGALPYVGGTLLAIRKVAEFVGLRRGLDTILDLR